MQLWAAQPSAQWLCLFVHVFCAATVMCMQGPPTGDALEFPTPQALCCRAAMCTGFGTQALRCAACRFHDAAVALPGKSLAFPKFWDMYNYEDVIREFGKVAVANASFGERSHIDFKAAKHFTNNHKGSLMSQVGCWAMEGCSLLHARTSLQVVGHSCGAEP